MDTFKIGQQIQMVEDRALTTCLSEKEIIAKEGDQAYVTGNKMLCFTSGDARGKLVPLGDVELDGYDYENISKRVLQRLKNASPLKDFMDDYEINDSEFLGEIEDVLMDIL